MLCIKTMYTAFLLKMLAYQYLAINGTSSVSILQKIQKLFTIYFYIKIFVNFHLLNYFKGNLFSFLFVCLLLPHKL